MFVTQPSPHGTSRQSDRSRVELRGVGRIDLARQRVEELPLVTCQLRGSDEKRDGVPAHHIGQERKDLVTHSIAPEADVSVRRIHQRLVPDGCAHRLGVAPSQPQQRAASGRHRGERIDSTSPEQLQ